ncbi:hypothetical protein CC80DRAFT_579298 [Byssothecium circinans]|uniref:LYC1 C-terminal domain-containing protein n=1 Tax=Byssothecium circinans TaxID=147558 RepID=A0A6A5TLJ4_9PLEO|nr:hypothetical protein CC80DRAFT_579298 [Byssothecium circinans]
MSSSQPNEIPKSLPSHDSPNLTLSHPTPPECIKIWTSTATTWSDGLPLSVHLKESEHMTMVPLARDNQMTLWILVDKGRSTAQRPRRIYSSCETFRKRALMADTDGAITEGLMHGIASVFCPVEFRGDGFARRLMRDLAEHLRIWQAHGERVFGSVLFSDIGREYYGKLGWELGGGNLHVEIRAREVGTSMVVKDVLVEDVEGLCKRDEEMLRKVMGVPYKERRVTVIPDQEHMGWHWGKEAYACYYLFGKEPHAKGAIAGRVIGHRVWALWTHRYYKQQLDADPTDNVLYILRLVVEQDETASRLPLDADKSPPDEIYGQQLVYLKAVLQAAQNEAYKWQLGTVQLWDPTPLVMRMLKKMDFGSEVVERKEDGLACLMWYGDKGGKAASSPLWMNNEHYAWV